MTTANPAKQSIAKLKNDHISGSIPLAIQATRVLETFVPQRSATTGAPESDLKSALRLARKVLEAQPSMAAVLNVCNRWLLALQRGEHPATAAREIRRQLRASQLSIAAAAAGVIENGAVIATYSCSSTVLAALIQARRQGRRFRVICSESRPRYEGRLLATRLAARGIPVDLFCDAALLSEIPRATALLVGCDALVRDGFVNKSGTAALGRLARLAQRPFYVVADNFKLLPAALEAHFQIREEDAGEVWRGAAHGIRVHNEYFERVPMRLCTALILQTGTATIGQLRGLLRSVPVADGL